MGGRIDRVRDARGSIEATVLLVLAVISIVLEVANVDEIAGRDPFRILLPALVTIMALVLLDVNHTLRKLNPRLTRRQVTQTLLTQSPSSLIERDVATDTTAAGGP